MDIQTTTAQALKSFPGAAFFGLSLDLVSCRLTDLFLHILRELGSLIFWAVLAGLQASEAQILGEPVYFLICPLVSLLRPLLHLLGAAM
jgi:hypothetical protein